MACGRMSMLLVLLPCAHTICPCCVDVTRSRCSVPACGQAFSVDLVQQMQPGFMVQLVGLPRTSGAVAAVPQPLGPVGPGGLAGPAAALVLGPGVAVVPGQQAPTTRVCTKARYVVQALCRAQQTRRQRLRSAQLRRASSFMPRRALKRHCGGGGNGNGDGGVGAGAGRPLKAIVFSQFQIVLDYIGDQVLRLLGGAPEPGWLKRASASLLLVVAMANTVGQYPALLGCYGKHRRPRLAWQNFGDRTATGNSKRSGTPRPPLPPQS